MGQWEFMGITGHWYDDKWRLQHRTLELQPFPQRHTAENISASLTALALRFNARPYQVVSDSGANVKKGVRDFLSAGGDLVEGATAKSLLHLMIPIRPCVHVPFIGCHGERRIRDRRY